MKGRKPKTIDEHKAQGTYQPVRHANRVEAPPVDKLPAPPAHFDKRHRDKYKEVGEHLRQMGVLAVTDIDAVVTYVEVYLTREAAYKSYLKTGERSDFIVWRDTVQQQKRLQDDLGFTPRSRMSMKVEKPKEEETDPVAELLKSLKN